MDIFYFRKFCSVIDHFADVINLSADLCRQTLGHEGCVLSPYTSTTKGRQATLASISAQQN